MLIRVLFGRSWLVHEECNADLSLLPPDPRLVQLVRSIALHQITLRSFPASARASFTRLHKARGLELDLVDIRCKIKLADDLLSERLLLVCGGKYRWQNQADLLFLQVFRAEKLLVQFCKHDAAAVAKEQMLWANCSLTYSYTYR